MLLIIVIIFEGICVLCNMVLVEKEQVSAFWTDIVYKMKMWIARYAVAIVN